MALITVTDGNYKEEVLGYTGPLLLDFGAAWCAPCKKLDPIVKELAVEYAGKAKIAKVDIGEHREVATHFGVMNVPTLLFIREGKVRGTFASLVSKAKIVEKLEEIVKG